MNFVYKIEQKVLVLSFVITKRIKKKKKDSKSVLFLDQYI